MAKALIESLCARFIVRRRVREGFFIHLEGWLDWENSMVTHSILEHVLQKKTKYITIRFFGVITDSFFELL